MQPGQSSAEIVWKRAKSVFSRVPKPFPTSRSLILARSERSTFKEHALLKRFHTASARSGYTFFSEAVIQERIDTT